MSLVIISQKDFVWWEIAIKDRAPFIHFSPPTYNTHTHTHSTCLNTTLSPYRATTCRRQGQTLFWSWHLHLLTAWNTAEQVIMLAWQPVLSPSHTFLSLQLCFSVNSNFEIGIMAAMYQRLMVFPSTWHYNSLNLGTPSPLLPPPPFLLSLCLYTL